MEQLATKLEQIVSQNTAQFRTINEREAAKRPAPGVWSPKEVVGHLIDSAANNHHRFVRIQISDLPPAASYEQVGWMAANHYVERSWSDLVDLWSAYNKHLAHVIRKADPATLDRTLRVQDGLHVTLRFVMEDYFTHMERHLKQIAERTPKHA